MAKPLVTKSINAGSRVYYMDLMKDSNGKNYVSISEIPTDKAHANAKRHRVFVYPEKLDQFIAALSEISETIKKDTER